MGKCCVSRRAILFGGGCSLVFSSAFAIDLGDIGGGLEVLGSASGRLGRGSDGMPGPEEIAKGIRTALAVGVTTAVEDAGRTDGYFANKPIRITLPNSLEPAKAVPAVGDQRLLSALELQLNRGAEAAAPYAKPIFLDAISKMQIPDAAGILNGGDTAATEYFEATMSSPLRQSFQPILRRELNNTGAFITLKELIAQTKGVPREARESAQDEFIDYALEGALAGLFYYIGAAEAKIRNDPSARTNAVLQSVFS